MEQLKKTNQIICRFSPEFTLLERFKILFGYRYHAMTSFILDKEVEIIDVITVIKIIKNE